VLQQVDDNVHAAHETGHMQWCKSRLEKIHSILPTMITNKTQQFLNLLNNLLEFIILYCMKKIQNYICVQFSVVLVTDIIFYNLSIVSKILLCKM
jgi:hypothetical protein